MKTVQRYDYLGRLLEDTQPDSEAYWVRFSDYAEAQQRIAELETDNNAKDVAFDKLDHLCVANHERKKQAEARP